MNIGNHFANVYSKLGMAEERLDASEFDEAIIELVIAYSNVRMLLEHAWRMKRAKVLEEQPPGENSG